MEDPFTWLKMIAGGLYANSRALGPSRTRGQVDAQAKAAILLMPRLTRSSVVNRAFECFTTIAATRILFSTKVRETFSLCSYRPLCFSWRLLFNWCFDAGDYVSYMTPTTKDTRRADWKDLNFAGSIDWAVDLQSFESEDKDAPPEIPTSGEGCTRGEDLTLNSAEVCDLSCSYGFCPAPLCICTQEGKLEILPPEMLTSPMLRKANWT